jgi:hypothetical protein
MTYSTIQPPFTLQFHDMAKKDLIAYARWFHDSTAGRITELTGAVTSTPGYESWRPNTTPESLEDLGLWFEDQVETRKKQAADIAEDRAKLAFPIDVPDEELTNRTFSLAMDIGMYFAQVVLKSLPGTQWDQPLGNKKFADYGQPVIMGFGTIPLNPVRVMVTTAYAISRRKPADLRGLYDTWARMKR